MRYALIGRTGTLHDAYDSVARKDYVCPCCSSRVFLRKGDQRDPHFAHYSEEGSPDCEEYHPGFGTGRSEAPTFEVTADDDPAQLGLILEQHGQEWNLLLRLPEIPAAELGLAALATLRDGIIDVFAGASAVSRVSALEVRPGLGSARAVVPPTTQPYRTKPGGGWPAGIVQTRWEATSTGLNAIGTLFKLRSGEWVRLMEGSAVRWGEHLILVGDERTTIANPLHAERANSVSAGGMTWRLWRVHLPVEPDPTVESWILRLGYRVSAPVWELSSLSIPVAFGESLVPFFPVREPVVVQLSPPNQFAAAMLSVRWNSNAVSRTIDASSAEQLYAVISASSSCAVTLEVAAENSAAIAFEFVDDAGEDRTFEQLATVPRLRVSVGNQRAEAWQPRRGTTPREGDVQIATGVEGARVNLMVRAAGSRRVFSGLACGDAARAVAASLGDADRIEVDAGNLGLVALNFAAVGRAHNHVEDRLDRWLRLPSVPRPNQNSAFSLFTRNRADGRMTRVSIASARIPHLRALVRRCSRSKGETLR